MSTCKHPRLQRVEQLPGDTKVLYECATPDCRVLFEQPKLAEKENEWQQAMLADVC